VGSAAQGQDGCVAIGNSSFLVALSLLVHLLFQMVKELLQLVRL